MEIILLCYLPIDSEGASAVPKLCMFFVDLTIISRNEILKGKGYMYSGYTFPKNWSTIMLIQP